jgi:predicted O-methyltransferase YrrM/prolipoprotein diacylglyceryltransferase
MTPPFDAQTWMEVLTLLLGFFVTASVLKADLLRRKIRAHAYLVTAIAFFMGCAFAYFAVRLGLEWFAGFIGEILALALVAQRLKIPILEFLDAYSPAAAAGEAVVKLPFLLYLASQANAHSYKSPSIAPLYECFVWIVIAVFLWRMGMKATLGPKPAGEIFCFYLLLTAAARFVIELGSLDPAFLFVSSDQIARVVTFFAAGILLWWILARYHRVAREHRILQHVAERGDVVQQEYSRATPECPHPERWRMYDAMSAEVEVLDFLKTLVTTTKPERVVETGSFLGSSTLRIAEGLRENGFGRVITCEADPKVFEQARKRFLASGLSDWIELRNESSLEMIVAGRIDLLYCDSDLPLREQEVRRFLPQMNPDGLILMHDASSGLKTVREGARNLEREGLLSVVFLPTPRGLVVAQKREGRS